MVERAGSCRSADWDDVTRAIIVRAYFLRSRRLGFSIWTHADLPLAFELWGDPEVTALTGGPFTPQQVRRRLEREINNHEEHGIQYWPIFLAETGEHIGCCGLQPHKPAQGIYELEHTAKVKLGNSLGPHLPVVVLRGGQPVDAVPCQECRPLQPG